jgi:hypothetical protein
MVGTGAKNAVSHSRLDAKYITIFRAAVHPISWLYFLLTGSVQPLHTMGHAYRKQSITNTEYVAQTTKRENMSESEVSKPKPVTAGSKATVDRLFVLDLSGGRVFSLNTDGFNQKDVVTGCRHPDGIVVDVDAGHIYWTNMGVPKLNDGSIERADLDGRNRKMIVPEGGTFTPKQLHLDKKNGKLYWSDREGMRVMRCNIDGSNIETLVQTGHDDADRGDATKWCVGIAVDSEYGQIYSTQKGPDKAGKGRIFRAGTEIPKGQTAANRTDIEVLFDNLPRAQWTGSRSQQPNVVLDGSWRSSTW